MNNNYVIKASDGEVFGGWNNLGMIVMKAPEEKNLAYRMSRTVALRNLEKVREFTRKECEVIAV
ncbi:MAG: hypothetical protein K6F53_03375 [Lachnospiraceae bacterium]|nr:hypothetical protein [Lachnospiraceae bacterium]